jgi:hypothetical protein
MFDGLCAGLAVDAELLVEQIIRGRHLGLNLVWLISLSRGYVGENRSESG